MEQKTTYRERTENLLMKKSHKIILSIFFFAILLVACLFIHTHERALYRVIPWQHTCHSKTWKLKKEPTCTEDGLKIQTCDLCDKTFNKKTLKKLNHKYDTTWETTKKPTCTEKGTAIQRCERCHEIIHKKTLKKLKHKLDTTWKTTKEPTCTETGTAIQRCKRCHEIIHQKELPAKGHHYKDNYCVDCHNEIYRDVDSKTLILACTMLSDLGIPSSGDVIIPQTVHYEGIDYTIIGIGYGLFYGCKDITSVILPDTIKYIKGHAFDLCENLQTINLPNGLLTIEEAAFQCCYNLQHVFLPDTVETIKNFAFNHCQSLDASSFHIPTNVKCIGDYTSYPAHMFYNCGTEDFTAFDIADNKNGYSVDDGILYAENEKTLVSIPRGKHFENDTYIMPNTIEHIGELSFSRNTHVKTVVISDNLLIDGHMSEEERISYNNITNQLSAACYVYSTVNKYETRDSNPHYKAVNGILYDKNMTTVIAVPNQYEGILDVPEGVTTWSYEALWTDIDYFENLAFNKMSEIHIPASMTNIDEHQLENLNNIHDMYGTKLTVNENNTTYIITNGHITKKDA